MHQKNNRIHKKRYSYNNRPCQPINTWLLWKKKINKHRKTTTKNTLLVQKAWLRTDTWCGGVKLISGTLHSALYQIFIHINIFCYFRHLFKKEKVENGVFAANCESCGHFIKFQVKSDVNSKITVTINGQKYTGKTFI